MATLHFGTTDRKVFTPVSAAMGDLSNAAGTIVVLVKKTASGGSDFAGLTNSSVSTWYHGFGHATVGADVRLWDDDNTTVNATTTTTNDNTNWYLYGLDWPTGTGQIERFHRRDQTGLGSWTHDPADSLTPNTGQRAGPGTGGWWTLGYFGDYSTGAKDLAVVAVWKGVRFGDSDYGTWSKTSDLANHALGPPSFLCELTASTPVDLMGASTYSSANSSGTSLTGADPDNWTMDGLGSAVTGVRPTFNAIPFMGGL